MLIFADENVPTLVVIGLRTAGHNVTWGCEYDQGVSDVARMAEAHRQGRVILTEDKDFAELVIAQGFAAHGVIRFDLPGLNRERKAARILNGITEIGTSAKGSLFVIEHARLRSRQIA